MVEVGPVVKDEDSLVVFKGKLNYVVLNLYPYNAGHLLVAPFRHFADFTTITKEESDEMSELTRKAMSVLRKASGAQGFNIGMNQGRITHIGPTQIDLVEIVPDGREGYVERPRTLVLIGPAP